MMKQSNPRIRFKEFNNKWGNYKLGQLGIFKSGIGFSDSQQGGTEGIPFFKVSDMNNIGNETEMRNANNYVTQEQIMKNSWKVINETPAIIFAKVGAALMLNRKRLVTRPFLIDNNTMSYSFDESWDKDFGLTLFQTINLPKYAQIGALPSYNASDIAMIKVNVPDVQEQSAIGSLFRTLDDLLASYKDNLANYQSLKAVMLSKMFPKAGQTVPEIRLDGFEGEWVEKRLKDISKRVTRKNSDLVSERALTISAQFGLIDQEEFFQKKIASKDVSGYYLIKKGEFAYNKSYSTGYPLGAIKRLDKYENGVLSTLYILFKAVDVDSDYLAHYYESDKWHREVSMCAAEGARNHGLLNIAPADFFNTRLVMPKELEEQQAIGSYFSNLDNLINSHQEKISQLETMKKKLLQDMFI